MNELELWMNPNLSIEVRFEIARGEIARLNEVIAKLSAEQTPQPKRGRLARSGSAARLSLVPSLLPSPGGHINMITHFAPCS